MGLAVPPSNIIPSCLLLYVYTHKLTHGNMTHGAKSEGRIRFFKYFFADSGASPTYRTTAIACVAHAADVNSAAPCVHHMPCDSVSLHCVGAPACPSVRVARVGAWVDGGMLCLDILRSTWWRNDNAPDTIAACSSSTCQ